MKVIWYYGLFVLLATLTISTCKEDEEDDVFTSCLNQEVCDTPGGYDNAEFCLNMLGEKDMKYVLDAFSRYYDMPIESYGQLINQSCSNPEEAAKAINEYYDERRVYDNTVPYTVEDETKLLAERQGDNLIGIASNTYHVTKNSSA